MCVVEEGGGDVCVVGEGEGMCVVGEGGGGRGCVCGVEGEGDVCVVGEVRGKRRQIHMQAKIHNEASLLAMQV